MNKILEEIEAEYNKQMIAKKSGDHGEICVDGELAVAAETYALPDMAWMPPTTAY